MKGHGNIKDQRCVSVFGVFVSSSSVADPGFPVGGRGPVGGSRPSTWSLFGENVGEKERIGSCRGACTGHTLDLPMMILVDY